MSSQPSIERFLQNFEYAETHSTGHRKNRSPMTPAQFVSMMTSPPPALPATNDADRDASADEEEEPTTGI